MSTFELFGYVVAVSAVVMGIILIFAVGRKKPRPVAAQGTLLVTGSGNVVVDKTLLTDHRLLQDPERFIVVEFDPLVPVPPPCAHDNEDSVDWELIYQPHHNVIDGKLQLKVIWHVNGSRHVVWTVYAS